MRYSKKRAKLFWGDLRGKASIELLQQALLAYEPKMKLGLFKILYIRAL
jgi:hypothetical protein